VKQPLSPALVGAFVVGALALLVLGVLIFGAGTWLGTGSRYVMYFSGSVNGLDLGAPVKFRGVNVGKVAAIELQIDPADREVHIPVLVDLLPGVETSFGARDEEHGGALLRQMIERGLRAQLKEQSLVTGKLMIELEYHRDEPLQLVGSYPELTEIPTVPTDFEQIAQEVEDGLAVLKRLPLEQLFARLLRTLEGVDQLVRSENLSGAINAARGAAEGVQEVTASAEGWISPMAKELALTLAELRTTLADSRALVARLDRELVPAAVGLRGTLSEVDGAARQAREAFAGVEATLAPDSPLVFKLDQALEELALAVRSLRVTADYLQQNPDALIYGKRGYGGR
jgi:paraquat-inducible protein B